MGSIFTRIASNRYLLVQRHLTNTVDGVVGVINFLRHAVWGALHHHAAAEDTAEIGTLDGVHDTSGIDRNHAILLPIGRIRLTIGQFVCSCKQ